MINMLSERPPKNNNVHGLLDPGTPPPQRQMYESTGGRRDNPVYPCDVYRPLHIFHCGGHLPQGRIDRRHWVPRGHC